MGASPRATRNLYRAAKVWAAMDGRDYVTPDDVKVLAVPVLEHRLVLESSARFSGASAGSILADILARVPAAPEAKRVLL
jgi:MoxR-like ATPase